jgi:hypothetical protein
MASPQPGDCILDNTPDGAEAGAVLVVTQAKEAASYDLTAFTSTGRRERSPVCRARSPPTGNCTSIAGAARATMSAFPDRPAPHSLNIQAEAF